MANRAISHLIAVQSADGGFGAYPAAESRTEATGLAALALHLSAEPEARDPAASAFAWLEATQLSSGAWPLSRALGEPSWSTSLAVLALSYADPRTDAVARGAEWLLAEEGEGSVWWVRLLFTLFPQRKSVELDADLTGWPWATGTFSWVEPTAYAMLALKRLRGVVSDRRLEEPIGTADLMLADRACVDGGWNYGNSRVLGEDLWAYPDTTAAALMALADRRDLAQVTPALDLIPGMLAENDSILALSMCSLALSVHGRDRAVWRERLADKIETWRSGEVRALSWAALALVEADDVMGLSA